jgi:hypothetical protein
MLKPVEMSFGLRTSIQAYAELWFDNDSWYDEQYELND